MTSNKIYKYIFTNRLDNRAYRGDWSKCYKPTESVCILLDESNDKVLVKTSRGFSIKKSIEVSLDYIYESDNQNLHDMFTSKNTDINKIGKEIVRQELLKLKNDGEDKV